MELYLLSLADIAKYLGISKQAAFRMKKRKEFPQPCGHNGKKSGKHVLVYKAEDFDILKKKIAYRYRFDGSIQWKKARKEKELQKSV